MKVDWMVVDWVDSSVEMTAVLLDGLMAEKTVVWWAVKTVVSLVVCLVEQMAFVLVEMKVDMKAD
jgi:hypothetical protein